MAEALGDAGEDSPVTMPSQRRARDEGTNFSLKCLKDKKVPIGVTLVVAVLLLTIISLAVKKCPSCPNCPPPVLPSCWEKGIGFGEKCFYFLEEEADWNGSASSCLALGAHLATIDSQEELVRCPGHGTMCLYQSGRDQQRLVLPDEIFPLQPPAKTPWQDPEGSRNPEFQLKTPPLHREDQPRAVINPPSMWQ
ncbi:uncharacterized protein isoform X1 [Numenius arquata]|uniref:uncharacterized protein isoform X1 n=1 Tax=Numenius arquata TaxID=31919 RepID=UPI003D30827B